MKMDDKERDKIEAMIEEAESLKSVEIKDGIFFVPDDCDKFKGRGRWVLHVKEGKLVKIDGAEEKEKNSSSGLSSAL